MRSSEVIEKQWKGHNIETNAVQQNHTLCQMIGNQYVKSLVLTVNQSLWSAYPYPAGINEHPVEIRKIIQWENRIEAQYEIGVYGAGLGMFDPLYFVAMGNLPTRALMNFSAFAYNVRKAKARTFKGQDGQDITTKGAAMVFPANTGAIDDLGYQIPVEKVEPITLLGFPGYRFTGPLFIGEKPFVIPVYAATSNIKGDIPEVGDDIEGVLWLQGTMSKQL